MSNLGPNASSVSPTIDLINLNCLVLGDDPSCTFQVRIALTSTVGALKNAIKEERTSTFDTIAAARLELWKVNLSVDDEIRPQLQDNDKISRSPLLKLSKFFSGHLDEAHVHVVIKPPPLVSSVSPAVNLISLNCLVLGDDPNCIFPINIAQTGTVGDLEKLIKEEKNHAFGSINACYLRLWKVNLPVGDKVKQAILGDTLRNLELHTKDSLFPATTLFQVFPDFPSQDHLHIIVWCGNEQVPTNVERPADAIMELTRVFQNTLQLASEIPTPSAASKSSEYLRIQGGQARIYDGRYACDKPENTNAPPIQLFNPAFAYFSSKAFDTTYTVPDATLRTVWKFITNYAAICHKEDDDKIALTHLLEELIAHPLIHAESRHRMYWPDGTVFSSHGHLIFLEEKNEIGGGSDPAVQASFSFLKFSTDKDMEACLRCNCPAFLIARAGPWLAVLGAVLTERCIVQRLTDYIWIPIRSTLDNNHLLRIGRVLYALKESVALLENWYGKVFEREDPPFDISHPVPHSRFFPTPDTYIQDGSRVQFTYQWSLESNPSCVTYLALTVGTKPMNVVVKFVTRYGEEVHKAMADAGLAPKLLYYGPINVEENMPSYGRLKMVVMEFVDGSTAFNTSTLPPNFRLDLKKAIEYCHGRGFVIGDLRKPNVMITKDQKVQLIDFDWAGREGEVTYPMSISPNFEWPEGVKALEPILRRHDLDMLEDYCN